MIASLIAILSAFVICFSFLPLKQGGPVWALPADLDIKKSGTLSGSLSLCLAFMVPCHHADLFFFQTSTPITPAKAAAPAAA